MDYLSIELVEGTPPVLRVTGEIDLGCAEQLASALDLALATQDGLVVDLTGVTFIDVVGLRVILRAAEGLNGRGPLRLVGSAPVARLLELAGVGDVPWIDVAS